MLLFQLDGPKSVTESERATRPCGASPSQAYAELTSSRLGAEEAKRREGLRAAEQQAQAEHKGIWAEEPENVSTESLPGSSSQ